jgi:hypothetical protein
MLRVSQLAALFIASMVASAGHGADYFGAIAYSAQTRQYGWANNHPSRDSAEQAALPVCRKGGVDDCRVVVWFRNGCGALAVGVRGFGADWGESKAPAEKKALAACARRSPKCTLTRSFCTGQ